MPPPADPAEPAALGEDTEDVPLRELQARLTEYEARIRDVVRQDAEGTRSTVAGESAVESDAAEESGATGTVKPSGTTSSRAPMTTSARPTGGTPTTSAATTSAAPTSSGTG